MGGALARSANGQAMLFELGAVDVLGYGLVGGGLAGQDEAGAALLDGLGDRLAGEQVVAEIDRLVACQGGAMLGQPALGSVALAILLFRAVLRGDELGRQRQHLLVAGCHQAGAEKGVEELGAAIGATPRGALRAMDLARAEVLGPVERDQHASVEALERRQRVGGNRHGLHEQPVEGRGRGAVQHHADIVVRRDRRHSEQRLAVRSAMALRQGALMGQERRAAHEEQRERRQADIRHRVGAIALRPLSPVRKTGADLLQIRDQALQRAHASVESRIDTARKLKPLDIATSPSKIYRLWQIRVSHCPQPHDHQHPDARAA